jgi:WD40 repeat protein
MIRTDDQGPPHVVNNMTQTLRILPDTRVSTLAILLCTAGTVSTLRAEREGLEVANIERDENVDFDAEILPILKKNCLACHNGSKARGSVNLENAKGIRDGADGDAIIDPSNPEDSLLFIAAAHRDEPIMPPKSNKVGAHPLNAEELGLLRLWIAQGAPDSAGDGKKTGSRGSPKWQAFPSGLAPIYSVAISDDERWVASGRANEIWAYELGSELAVRLVDPKLVETGIYKEPRVAHLDSVQSLAIHPDGELLASGGFRTVKMWRRTDARLLERNGAGSTDAAHTKSEDASSAEPKPERVTLEINADGKVELRDRRDASRVLGHANLPSRASTILRLDRGKRLVVGCEDGSIHMLALLAESGLNDGPRWRFHEQRALPSHEGKITLLSLAADSQILSAAADGKIRWIDSNGTVVREIALEVAATLLELHPDGQHLAVSSAEGSVKLVSFETGKAVREFVARSPEEKALARRDSVHKLLETRVTESNAALEETRKKLKAAEEAVAKAKESIEAAAKAITEKESALAAVREKKAAHDKSARMAESALEAARATIAKIDVELKELEGLGEGESVKLERTRLEAEKADNDVRLASGLEGQKAIQAAGAEIDKEIAAADKEFSAATGKRVEAKRQNDDATRDFRHGTEAVKTAGVTHESAGARATASLAVIETSRNAVNQRRGSRMLAFSSDGSRLACARSDGSVAAWQVADGRFLARVDSAIAGEFKSVAFAGETQDRLVVESGDGSSTQWQLEPRWTLEHTIGSPDNPSVFADRVASLSFSYDGELLAIGGGEPSRGGSVEVRKLNGDTLWRLPNAHSDAVLGLEFSADGDYLASCGADRVVRVFDVREGKSIVSFEGHTDHVLGVSWRFDGKLLASCGADRVIKVWSFHERKQVRTIGGFGKQVTAIRFVADTPHAVACSGDSAVRLHHSDNGNKVRDYGGAKDYLYSLAVSPRGHLIAVGGFDSIVRVWNVEDGKLVKELKGD